MQASLTQPERISLATDAVNTLKDLVAAVDANMKTNKSTLLQAIDAGEISSDGSVSFSIHKTDSSYRFQSNHQKLADCALEADFKALFEKAAIPLRKLFPGRHIVFERTKGTPRYTLALGKELTSRITPINTTLSRWKTPLVRLSKYLDGIDRGDGTVHSWLITSHCPDIEENQTYKVGAVRIDAQSLEEALRYDGFVNATDATPTPKPATTEFVLRLDDKYTRNEYKNSLADYASSIEPEYSAILEEFDNASEELFAKYQSAFTDALRISDVSLNYDLITGAFESSLQPIPFSASRDLARLPAIKSDLDACVLPFFSLLKEFFDRVHPTSQRATLHLNKKSLRTGEPWTLFPGYNIDGGCIPCTNSGARAFFRTAAEMAHAIKKAPVSLYCLQELEGHARETVGSIVKTHMVQATSFAHASAILGSRFQSYNILRKVTPVELEKIQKSVSSQQEALRIYQKK
jgi:hypothetical protein